MNHCAASPHRLLLIDDNQGQLDRLEKYLTPLVSEVGMMVELWRPKAGESLRETLPQKLAPRPAFVVTDRDLTENGAAGLFGRDVAAWCRAHAIPVGDYSNLIPYEDEEPDLFEFHFSAAPESTAVEIANIALGFAELPPLLAAVQQEGSGWSHTLAEALGKPDMASAFSLYSARTGSNHGAVIERIQKQCGPDRARELLETYVVGHLLHNGILRYPGPIMGALALCSYLAISDTNADALAELFETAKYVGPFGHRSCHYWQSGVDDRLLDLADAVGLDGDLGDALFRREIVSKHLDPGTHPCSHCDGTRGGFRCPYTDRTTCDLPQCSVPTTSWIPQGAYLNRVDRDYYERWAPLLGM